MEERLDEELFPGVAARFVVDAGAAMEKCSREELRTRYKIMEDVNLPTWPGRLVGLRNQLETNSMYAQRIMALLMAQLPDGEREFFGYPSSGEMYQTFEGTQKVDVFLGGEAANALQSMISSMRDQNAKFAESVRTYFKDDITTLAYFGSVTFAALYNYFLSDEFCDRAATMLTNYIECADEAGMVAGATMIGTFFFNAYGFLGALWSAFMLRVTQSPPIFEAAFKQTLLDCIELCSHLFDQYRRRVLKALEAKDSQLCYQVLMTKVLWPSFSLFFGHGNFIVHKFVMQFGDHILNGEEFGLGKLIVESILKVPASPYALPPMPDKSDVPSCLVYWTRRDLYYMMDIFRMSKELPANMGKWRDSLEELISGYSPVLIGYFLVPRKEDRVEKTFDKAKRARLGQIENTLAPWNKTIFDYIANNPDEDFEKFALLHEIYKKEKLVEGLSRKLDSHDVLARHKDYFEHMRIFYDNFIWKHCALTLPSFPNGNVASDQLLSHVIAAMKTTLSDKYRSELPFQYFITILNQFDIVPDKHLTSINDQFSTVFKNRRKDVEQSMRVHRSETVRIERLFQCANSCFDWGIGRQFITVLSLMEQLAEIDKKVQRTKKVKSRMKIFMSYGLYFTESTKLINILMLVRQLRDSSRMKKLLEKHNIPALLPERENRLFNELDQLIRQVIGSNHHIACYLTYNFRPTTS